MVPYLVVLAARVDIDGASSAANKKMNLECETAGLKLKVNVRCGCLSRLPQGPQIASLSLKYIMKALVKLTFNEQKTIIPPDENVRT